MKDWSRSSALTYSSYFDKKKTCKIRYVTVWRCTEPKSWKEVQTSSYADLHFTVQFQTKASSSIWRSFKTYGSISRQLWHACLPYTIANIYFNNPHNISACLLLSRRQETGTRKDTVLYALRINQRHSVANTTFELNLNFPVLSHHIIVKLYALKTLQPSDRSMVLGSSHF